MRKVVLLGLAATFVVAGVAGIALAAETITYTYDVHGRLTKVARDRDTAPTLANTSYSYDKADNRLTKTTTTN